MASISLNVSTEYGSSVRVGDVEFDGDCLFVSLETYIGQGHLYTHDRVTIHGSVADIRLLATKIIGALPREAADGASATAAAAVA